jgi:hypothetical protein
MSETDTARRYRANLRGEVDSASLYRTLAETEPDPHLAEVRRRLAAVEEAHAEFWKKQLGGVGVRIGRLQPGWRTWALSWLARLFGPQFVLPTISSRAARRPHFAPHLILRAAVVATTSNASSIPLGVVERSGTGPVSGSSSPIPL